MEDATGTVGVRLARLEDSERLAQIYAYYVNETAITFEYAAPSAK